MKLLITSVFFYLMLLLLVLGCKEGQATQTPRPVVKSPTVIELENDTNQLERRLLSERILPPSGFTRVPVVEKSFENYLRNIPLRPKGSQVRYYNGSLKTAAGVYCEVVDLAIGSKNLHQCADAVMRLRGEYLWKARQYDQIHFNFTNGHKVEYSEWMKGRRMIVQGNTTKWDNRSNPSNTYEDFWAYMELIFTYAGTASLEKELIEIPMAEMRAGDVLIQGGHPGHAVIVMDRAIKESTSQKLYLLAQSYMPAQELQILINPTNDSISPWYALDQRTDIRTPEWTFENSNLRRFKN